MSCTTVKTHFYISFVTVSNYWLIPLLFTYFFLHGAKWTPTDQSQPTRTHPKRVRGHISHRRRWGCCSTNFSSLETSRIPICCSLTSSGQYTSNIIRLRVESARNSQPASQSNKGSAVVVSHPRLEWSQHQAFLDCDLRNVQLNRLNKKKCVSLTWPILRWGIFQRSFHFSTSSSRSMTKVREGSKAGR